MQNYQPSLNVQIQSGIIFGPGRTQRLPDPGTIEYKQLVERMRKTVDQFK